MSYRIALVGAGRVAWHLGAALIQAGHQIVAHFARRKSEQAALFAHWGVSEQIALQKPDFRKTNADLLLLTVSDAALSELELLSNPKTIVLHTSGSMPLSILARFGRRRGVFYPLQTFSKEKKISFEGVPLCLEADNAEDEAILLDLASSLLTKPQLMSSEQRRNLHLAAVWACNFTNHCWAISEQILKKEGFELSLLHGLIEETFQKIKVISPLSAQTGPAIRGDLLTQQSHLTLMAQSPEAAKLYADLSAHIVFMAQNKA